MRYMRYRRELSNYASTASDFYPSDLSQVLTYELASHPPPAPHATPLQEAAFRPILHPDVNRH